MILSQAIDWASVDVASLVEAQAIVWDRGRPARNERRARTSFSF